MKVLKVHEHSGEKTFVLVFETGDEAMAGLSAFARENGLASSRITAIGAFQSVVLGYFDWEKKTYWKVPVDEQVEVLSLIGDVALDEKGKPQVHAHVVVGRSDATTQRRAAGTCWRPASVPPWRSCWLNPRAGCTGVTTRKAAWP